MTVSADDVGATSDFHTRLRRAEGLLPCSGSEPNARLGMGAVGTARIRANRGPCPRQSPPHSAQRPPIWPLAFAECGASKSIGKVGLDLQAVLRTARRQLSGGTEC